MYKCAIIGDYDSIYGFGALGIDVFPVEGYEEAVSTMKNLDNGTYAVIYITEALVELMPGIIEKYDEELIPAIIPIPGVAGNTGVGIENVKKTVERAVGSDIIFGSEK